MAAELVDRIWMELRDNAGWMGKLPMLVVHHREGGRGSCRRRVYEVCIMVTTISFQRLAPVDKKPLQFVVYGTSQLMTSLTFSRSCMDVCVCIQTKQKEKEKEKRSMLSLFPLIWFEQSLMSDKFVEIFC